MREEVKVGNVGIGSGNPVRIQSMTNTNTSDADSTVKQILELENEGSELVRFTVKDSKDAAAVSKIKNKLEKEGSKVPVIGDFHFNGHLLLKKFDDCASSLDKYRINPGNVGFEKTRDKNFETILDIAKHNKKPIRIGVNFGSLDQNLFKKIMDENKGKSSDEITKIAMVKSALESAKFAEDFGVKKIILSAKVSKVPLLIDVYRELGKSKYPLHLGLTEAGMGSKGIIASTAGLSVLLNESIGDTIRVSITPSVNSSRTEEVKIAKQILQLNGLRKFMPTVTSCPGCGRTSSKLFLEITEEITKYLDERSSYWKKNFNGSEEMVVAVMGCVVNGPGESRDANIGLSLPGDGENVHPTIYEDGKEVCKINDNIIENFKSSIEEYVKRKY